MGNRRETSNTLARRALVHTFSLALAGAGLGSVAILRGTVAGLEIVLVLSCVVFSTVMLLVLLFCREMPVQAVATVATSYFTLYVIAGSVMAVSGADEHLHLFVYLVWFFPVLVFNKLVNGPTTGRWIAKVLLAVPGLLVVLLSPRLIKGFQRR